MKIKAIIIGSTGMVGKGILLECLENEDVKSVLVINRRSIQMEHPRLKEIIHQNFSDFSSIEKKLKGYNACFFSLGVSSVGMSEPEYTKITFDLTKEFAKTLHKLNPSLVFNYVCAEGADSSEKGSIMWARVRGKTENMLLNMNFKDVYIFRPGLIIPEKGTKSATPLYNFFYVLLRPFFGLLRKMKSVTTTTNVGRAMIHSVLYSYEKKHLDNKEINQLARKNR